jgi:competence protein ComEC
MAETGKGARAVAGVWAGALGASARPLTLDRLRVAFARWLERERLERRSSLWLAPAFGLGVLAYFAADREPALVAAPLVALAAFALAWKAARGPSARALGAALMVALFFSGFSAAALRTRLVAAPVLDHIRVAKVTGFVETVDDRGQGGRMLIRVASVEGLAPDATPQRVRVTTRRRASVAAGASIRATMRLLPPARASEPGGYDFGRDAFFQGIGAVGSVMGPVETLADLDVGWKATMMAMVDRGRNALTDRIVEVVGAGLAPGDGAVAASLVTGKRGLIPEDANIALRGAGIYHVVSISGVHMVLAAGLFLWLARAALTLVPGLPLTRPIKSWAAILAIAGATSYCVFSGSEVATERSLVMTLVMLGAIVVGRPALAMRNLALAAIIILAREPETILGPSFQMSFAAVGGLIAAFERGPGAVENTPSPTRRAGLWRERVRLMLFATVISSLVASLTTDPFATFHFHRATPYGLIGNALTLPLVEFVVMPAALVGVAAYPFGLDAPVWTVMGWGATGMMAVARYVNDLPLSTLHVPAFGVGALTLMAFGVVWWCLWISPLRWAGAALFALGLAVAARTPQPDLIVDAQARAVAVRGVDGALQIVGAKANGFGASQWLLADADGRDPRHPDTMGGARCDRQGCVVELKDGRAVALVIERAALAEDCARAAVVVTRWRTQGLCAGPDLVIDGETLEAHGAVSARIDARGFALTTDRRAGYDRPWAPSRKPAAPARAAAPPPAAVQRATAEPAPDAREENDPTLYAPD